MADNGKGVDETRSSNVSEVRKQMLTLVTRRFEGTIEKPIDDVVLKVLSKRRKKWRKRHHLPPEVGCQAPSPALREEKEQLTDRVYRSGERLLACRRSSYALARQLEGDKRKLQLQVAESHLQRFTCATQQVSEGSEPPTVQSPANDTILKDLQQALSQANALAKVRQMKLTMTPRLPPLDRRELPVGDSPNEQFGMSLLVPPQQVMQSASRPDDGRVENGELEISPDSTQQPLCDRLLSSVAPSDVDISLSGGRRGEKEFQQVPKGDSEGQVDRLPGTNGAEEHMDLDPAVELAPVNEIHDHDDCVCHSPDTLPRVACVMSFMEGQDTASVVEVMADDVVIETHSSLGSERGQAAADQSSMEDHLDPDSALPLVPEKEEIVSTTPENLDETDDLSTTPEHANHIATSPESLTDQNHLTAEEELVEMIMKDSQLAAWIAKARLRPRPPISYRDKRRNSRSRSSSRSVHD